MNVEELNKFSKTKLIELLLDANDILKKLPRCSNPSCNKIFIKTSSNKKYCSRKCLIVIFNKTSYNKDYYLKNRNKFIEKSKARWLSFKNTENYKIGARKRIKKWRKNKPDVVKGIKNRYYNNNSDKILQKQKSDRDILCDTYVKSVIKKQVGNAPEISKEVIEQRKVSLKIKRLINEKQRAINSQGNNGRTDDVLSGTNI